VGLLGRAGVAYINGQPITSAAADLSLSARPRLFLALERLSRDRLTQARVFYSVGSLPHGCTSAALRACAYVSRTSTHVSRC
jgi:hypothetical protein